MTRTCVSIEIALSSILCFRYGENVAPRFPNESQSSCRVGNLSPVPRAALDRFKRMRRNALVRPECL